MEQEIGFGKPPSQVDWDTCRGCGRDFIKLDFPICMGCREEEIKLIEAKRK